MKRIWSIDITRGMVMIIMALDHTRDLLHITSVTQSPTDLATTTPLLFFTRWITYLCAPVFVFLAGTSARLAFKKKNDVRSSRLFLMKRGLWLVLLEFTVVNFGLFFDAGFHMLLSEVIAAIGVGLIILSLLLRLQPKTIGLIGLVIIAGHNLSAYIPPNQGELSMKLFSALFSLAPFQPFAGHVFLVAYPPVPWLGILLTGFGAGQLFELPQKERKQLFLWFALASLLLFVVLRLVNLYGEPVAWSPQKNLVYTFLSFINFSKYPPSLLFCLFTLGIMFLVLSLTDGRKTKITGIVRVYGNVPLFYFIVHFYLIHTFLIALLFFQGFHWASMDFSSGAFGRAKGMANGLPLWGVYLVWVAVVAVLYRPCKWFGNYKATHRQWWLRYL